MERLTKYENYESRPYVIRANQKYWDGIYDRLAAYEDTGLTPEEIKGDIPNVRLIEEKLARYENAEAEGRLIVLPCNVGDTL